MEELQGAGVEGGVGVGGGGGGRMSKDAWAVALGSAPWRRQRYGEGRKMRPWVYGLNKHGTAWPPSESQCNSGEHRGAWESPLEEVAS